MKPLLRWLRPACAAAAITCLTTGGAMAVVGDPGEQESPFASTSRWWDTRHAVGLTHQAPVQFFRTGDVFALQPAELQISARATFTGPIAEAKFGIPGRAISAYKLAAERTAQDKPGCDLPWTLLAAIGRVESDHGRFGGSAVDSDGLVRPKIIGVQLNGAGPVAAIPDTDAGLLDGDRIWDRAVGPMQFIPSTWANSGRDGDGNGIADPHDLDDAAFAAAGYLCPSVGSLSNEATLRSSIFSYNRSTSYVNLVMAYERSYRTGVFVLPPTPPSADEPTEDPTGSPDPEPEQPKDPKPPKQPDGKNGDKNGDGKNGGGAEDDKKNDGKNGNGGGKNDGKGDGGKDEPEEPTPSPEPEPELDLNPVSGVWTTCGGGYCLTGYSLDLGSGGQLSRTATFDFDGDGAKETNRAEFDGLAGRAVTVHVKRGTGIVYIIGGKGYRNRDGSFA